MLDLFSTAHWTTVNLYIADLDFGRPNFVSPTYMDTALPRATRMRHPIPCCGALFCLNLLNKIYILTRNAATIAARKFLLTAAYPKDLSSSPPWPIDNYHTRYLMTWDWASSRRVLDL
jgi:hypothetical protein